MSLVAKRSKTLAALLATVAVQTGTLRPLDSAGSDDRHSGAELVIYNAAVCNPLSVNLIAPTGVMIQFASYGRRDGSRADRALRREIGVTYPGSSRWLLRRM